MEDLRKIAFEELLKQLFDSLRAGLIATETALVNQLDTLGASDPDASRRIAVMLSVVRDLREDTENLYVFLGWDTP